MNPSQSFFPNNDLVALSTPPLLSALSVLPVQSFKDVVGDRSASDILADIELLSKKDMPKTAKAIKKSTSTRHSHRGYTSEQQAALCATFMTQRYPSREQLSNISEYTGLDILKVRTWFQNSRTRGMPDCPSIATADPAKILSGAILATKKAPEVKTVPESDSWTQTAALPAGLAELFEMGVLDSMLGIEGHTH
ncbi:Homeobox domain [Carpediemonas membranifera]|uniref:Homeobox domain n=1 Tax=Carpediemonas membranifera TaxID=201153 RepID=A0A8J6B3T7_9EUKA|nr:Homeobox domain [Carpediemonas membranifera]|eukprot:KAG9389457.1 Homeobox domain [Carpediemonas membranifera]